MLHRSLPVGKNMNAVSLHKVCQLWTQEGIIHTSDGPTHPQINSINCAWAEIFQVIARSIPVCGMVCSFPLFYWGFDTGAVN